MKKLSMILTPLLMLLIISSSRAQSRIGVVGGVNIANLSGDDVDGEEIDFSSRTGLGIGGVLDIALNENFALRLEPMYLQEGAEQDIEGISGKVAYKAAYIELPVFLMISFGTGSTQPYLMAGGNVGILLNAELESTIEGLEGTADFDDLTESTNFGLSFGGGLNFQLENFSFFMEGRYTLGISDIFKAGTIEINGLPIEFSEADIKTRGIQILGGITIPLSRR